MTAMHTDRSPVLVALQRADARMQRDGQDPTPRDVIEAFAQAAQAQMATPRPAAGEASLGEGEESRAELERLRRAYDELEDQLVRVTQDRDQVRTRNATLRRAADRAASWWDAAKDLNRLWHAEEALREEAVARLEADRDERQERIVALATQVSELTAEQDELRDENAALADELAQVRRELEAATADTARHRHFYPWPDPSRPPEPCDCGATYPRDRVRRDDPRPEPEEMWDRIRDELAGWA
ncbi:hypothetical protein H0B56_12225 [Haloechinothrix sp. YIM 98757]|uniref:Replication region DNA-binding N-term n=1 Tax=Haloechinothrix aidingensis TaxID=2752311 RepID=A0A838AAN8_9PSEU|nr:hypothetical protein [Haloechinothrix aidingensis]MBA0126309.1 hypothetical protein [Haloechinothrix aidingensis]